MTALKRQFQNWMPIIILCPFLNLIVKKKNSEYVVICMDISWQQLSSNSEFCKFCSSKISCYDFVLIFLKRKMPLIRNVAQENLGNKAHRNCSGFVPQAGAKLKATWSMFPCFLTEVSVISGEHTAELLVSPCIIPGLMEWTKCITTSAEISLHKQVHQ